MIYNELAIGDWFTFCLEDPTEIYIKQSSTEYAKIASNNADTIGTLYDGSHYDIDNDDVEFCSKFIVDKTKYPYYQVLFDKFFVRSNDGYVCFSYQIPYSELLFQPTWNFHPISFLVSSANTGSEYTFSFPEMKKILDKS